MTFKGNNIKGTADIFLIISDNKARLLNIGNYRYLESVMLQLHPITINIYNQYIYISQY